MQSLTNAPYERLFRPLRRKSFEKDHSRESSQKKGWSWIRKEKKVFIAWTFFFHIFKPFMRTSMILPTRSCIKWSFFIIFLCCCFFFFFRRKVEKNCAAHFFPCFRSAFPRRSSLSVENETFALLRKLILGLY